MMMLMWPARWDDLGCKMSLSRSCQKCVVYSLFVEFKWGPSLSTLVLINIQISCYFFFRDIKHVCCKSTPSPVPDLSRSDPPALAGVGCQETDTTRRRDPTHTDVPALPDRGSRHCTPATIHNTRTGG